MAAGERVIENLVSSMRDLNKTMQDSRHQNYMGVSDKQLQGGHKILSGASKIHEAFELPKRALEIFSDFREGMRNLFGARKPAGAVGEAGTTAGQQYGPFPEGRPFPQRQKQTMLSPATEREFLQYQLPKTRLDRGTLGAKTMLQSPLLPPAQRMAEAKKKLAMFQANRKVLEETPTAYPYRPGTLPAATKKRKLKFLQGRIAEQEQEVSRGGSAPRTQIASDRQMQAAVEELSQQMSKLTTAMEKRVASSEPGSPSGGERDDSTKMNPGPVKSAFTHVPSAGKETAVEAKTPPEGERKAPPKTGETSDVVKTLLEVAKFFI